MEIIQLNLNEFDTFKSRVINDLEELKILLKNRQVEKTWLKTIHAVF